MKLTARRFRVSIETLRETVIDVVIISIMKKLLLAISFVFAIVGCVLYFRQGHQSLPEAKIKFPQGVQMKVFPSRKTTEQGDPSVKNTQRVYEAAKYQSRIVTLKHVAVSPDGKMLAVSGDGILGMTDSTLRTRSLIMLLDARNGQHLRSIWNYRVDQLLFSRDGKWLLTGGTKLRWWNTATGKLWKEVSLRADSFALSPDGKTLAVADYINNRLDIWQIEPFVLQQRFGFMADSGRIAFSRDGRIVRSSTGLIYDVASNSIKRWPQGAFYGDYIGRGVFSPDGELKAQNEMSSQNGRSGAKVVISSTRSGRQVWSTPPDNVFSLFGFNAAFSPDGKRLVLVNRSSPTKPDSQLLARLYDAQNGKFLQNIEREKAADIVEATDAVFTPDGKTVVLAGTGLDNAIKIVRLNEK